MKKGLLLMMIIFSSVGLIQSQCNDYYEWAEDYYNKGKYEKAEKYFYKTLKNCDWDYVKENTYSYLSEIYKYHLKNDSLYWLSIRNLIRLDYHSPYGSSSIEYVSLDPARYVIQPGRADLYSISREYCRHLCDIGAHDSAWFYFDEYARKNQYQSWCGFGSRGRKERDAVLEADILLHLNDTVKAIELISGQLGEDEVESGGEALTYFIGNIYAVYLPFRKTSILLDLIHHLWKGSGAHYYTRFNQYSIYGFNPKYWSLERYYTHNGKMDSLGLGIAALMETSLFESLLGKDSLYAKQVTTISGIARNANPGAYIETDDYKTYYLPLEQMTEWDATLYLGKRVEITGELVVEEQDIFNEDQVIHRVFNVIKNATYRVIKNENH